MKTSQSIAVPASPSWRSPLDVTRYDRHPGLRLTEREALAQLRLRQDIAVEHKGGAWPRPLRAGLARLVTPIDDVLRVVAHGHWRERHATVKVILGEMERRETAFWAWTRGEWIALLQATDNGLRQYVMAVAYLLAGHRDLQLAFPGTRRRLFAWKLFGRASVDGAVRRVGDELHRWGFGKAGTRRVPPAVCELLLRSGCADAGRSDASPASSWRGDSTPAQPHPDRIASTTSGDGGTGVLSSKPLRQSLLLHRRLSHSKVKLSPWWYISTKVR